MFVCLVQQYIVSEHIMNWVKKIKPCILYLFVNDITVQLRVLVLGWTVEILVSIVKVLYICSPFLPQHTNNMQILQKKKNLTCSDIRYVWLQSLYSLQQKCPLFCYMYFVCLGDILYHNVVLFLNEMCLYLEIVTFTYSYSQTYKCSLIEHLKQTPLFCFFF